MATVSRVINRHPQVSAQNVEAVRSAIARLGYTPPPRDRRIGRPRRTPVVPKAEFAAVHPGRAGSIALLFGDTSQLALRTRLTSRLIHGVEESLWRESLTMTLTRLPQSGEVPPALNHRTVDGMIVRAGFGNYMVPQSLRGFPCVHLFEDLEIPQFGDCVLEDNAAIGSMAAEHLLDAGCQDLAFLNALPEHPAMRSRASSFRDAAERRGAGRLRMATHSALPQDMRAGVAAMVDQLLADGPPAGVFLPGHDSAVECAIEALAGKGLMAGRDIQVVCCHNDVPVVQRIAPEAAVIDICPEAMGEAAVETLLWRLDHPRAARRRVLIEPAMVKEKADGTSHVN